MYSASFSSSSRPAYPSFSSRPASEQTLIEEVTYLHYLWRQGPPSKRKRGEDLNSPSESSKKPRVEEAQTQEKKKKKKKRKKKKKKPEGQQKTEESSVPIDGNWNPDSEWDTQNPSVNKEWASEATKTEVRPLTEEELLQLGQQKVQQKAARVFRVFLTKDREDESLPTSSDGEDEDDDDEEDGDCVNRGALAKELDARQVFDKMFQEDEELRRFYEQNCNCGAFECLVCAAIGEKVGKRFPDCVSLIQHAMKILKTKKKAAHRGYGRAICCLLGWNVERLPSVAKPPNSDIKPRACIPPPDEDEGQAPDEGDNRKGTDSDGETGASDGNDAKEEIESEGRREASDDDDAKEEKDSDGEREASDDNNAEDDQDKDKEPALD